MNILIINSGSSSLKVSLFAVSNNIVEKQWDRSIKGPLEHALSHLDRKELKCVGHRIVHGGRKYIQPLTITQDNLHQLDELAELAPLHNPSCLEQIYKVGSFYQWSLMQAAVFDTAFHAQIPDYASIYALPYCFYEQYGVKRFGFHGISHQFLWETYTTIAKGTKIITLHLGSGCSAAAIDNGISIDTSMGFSPLEGLMMGTRSGDIDPAIIDYLSNQLDLSIKQIQEILNTQSGLLGISGTSDMQLLLTQTDDKSKLAVSMFCYRIIKYIGAYTASLQGVDAIVFSGGIGENSAQIRALILDGLAWCGIQYDTQKNKQISLKPGQSCQISQEQSKIAIFVIATDENSLIAQQIVSIHK